MKRTLVPVLLTLLSLLATSAGAEPGSVQTDWSSGGGEMGPVTEFGDRFDTGTLAWRATPGQVALPSTSRESFPSEVITPDSDRPTRLLIADIDADGYEDIIVTDPLISPFDPDNRRGAIYLWRLEDGVWTKTSITEDFYGSWYVDAVDLDQDGDLDLIASAYYGEIDPPPPPPEQRNGRFAWFENLDGVGGAWEKREMGELFWGARWIDAADIDGDGDLDLAGCSELVGGPYEADAFVVWFENADGQGESWIQHDVSDDFDNAFEIQTVDVDGDGDIDFIVSGYDRFEWFESLDGSGDAWTRHVISPVFQGAGYFDTGDLDGDGDVDIFGGGLNTGVLAAWLNDGTGLSWSAFIAGAFSRGFNVDLADVDGDGDLDAVASGESGNTHSKLGWAENLGAGTSWILRYVSTLAPSNPWARAGDIDRDGKPELVASFEDAYGQNIQLAAYTLSDFLPSGMLQSSILDGGVEPSWGTITWDADVPIGTTLNVEVRASNDSGNLGPYTTVPANGTDLGALVDPSARYIQYRLSMSTSDVGISPVLREIELESAATASVGDVDVLPNALVVGAALPNPTTGSASLAYTLAKAAHVRAAVYDASGREVAQIDDALRSAGSYELHWDGVDSGGHPVATGAYFLRLRTDSEDAVRRIIRIR